MPPGRRKRNKAKRKQEIRMTALLPADHPPEDLYGSSPQYPTVSLSRSSVLDVEQAEDQMPLNMGESNGDSPKFFSAPCSPSHSLSPEEFGTEAVVIDGVVENRQILNGAALPEQTGEESASVACDRDSASTSVSASNLEDIVVEIASYREEEIPAEASVVPDRHIAVVAEEKKQAVEISEDPLEQEDSSGDTARLVPLPEDGDSSKFCRFSQGADTLPAEVGPCAPQMVQRTKWWNCCGILQVFHRPRR